MFYVGTASILENTTNKNVFGKFAAHARGGPHLAIPQVRGAREKQEREKREKKRTATTEERMEWKRERGGSAV